MALLNSPQVKLAIVGVSRDCFPIELTRRRLAALTKACEAAGQSVYASPTTVRSRLRTVEKQSSTRPKC